MSPHILIDQALDGVSAPSGQEDISLLVHRTATRAWKFGAANFPDPEFRPARPSNS